MGRNNRNNPDPVLTKKRENWGSRLGVIMAVAGSAIGLGEFLKIPRQVRR